MFGSALGTLVALALLTTSTTRAETGQPPAAAAPEVRSAAESANTPPAAEADHDPSRDLDPTKLVFLNVRLQHDELGDGNAIDLVLLRRDFAIPRPGRPGVRLALLRVDLPAGNFRLNETSTDGVGDLYTQILNVRPLSARLNLASGLAFQLPTATEDLLGTGKWQAAPTVIPVLRMPGRGLFFTKVQNYASFAGDDDRRDINYLTVNPAYLRFLGRRFLAFDTEAIADWERNGAISWKSGVLVGTALRGQRALWLKLEVPWGEHRRADWGLKASIALRGRR